MFNSEKIRMRIRAWRYRYKLDPNEIAFLLKNLKPGDTAIDIGAHKGGYTYWMHKAVGSEGRVVSFEPQPALASYLRRMKTAFQMENLTIVESGVSSRTGVMTLAVPAGGPSPSGTLETNLVKEAGAATHSVQVQTLDGYFSSFPGKVKFIKCDVEGHELDVFRGGEQLLKTHRPTLMFECEERHHTRYSSQDVFTFLTNLGFKGFFFLKGRLTPLAEFRTSQHGILNGLNGGEYVNNFIFLGA